MATGCSPKRRIPTRDDQLLHTIASYRDTFRLLLRSVQQRTGIKPHALDIDGLDATLTTALLDHLEHDRSNHPRTRNARLAGDPLALSLRGDAAPRARRNDRAR